MKHYSIGSRFIRAIYDIRRAIIHIVSTIWYKQVASITDVEYENVHIAFCLY